VELELVRALEHVRVAVVQNAGARVGFDVDRLLLRIEAWPDVDARPVEHRLEVREHASRLVLERPKDLAKYLVRSVERRRERNRVEGVKRERDLDFREE